MVDVFSKKKRSEIMSHIRSKNTSLEKKIFSYLKKNRIYFQKHYGKVPGKPDIAIPRKKKAIFIDGDFWHGHNYKKTLNRLPSSYWQDKISNNMKRDRINRRKLRQMGWKTIRIWENQIEKNEERTLEKILNFIQNSV